MGCIATESKLCNRESCVSSEKCCKLWGYM